MIMEPEASGEVMKLDQYICVSRTCTSECICLDLDHDSLIAVRHEI